MDTPRSRRTMLGDLLKLAAALAIPAPLIDLGGAAMPGSALPARHAPHGPDDADLDRLAAWSAVLRAQGLARPGTPLARAAARVGELAVGTPYVAGTLEEYLRAGGSGAGEEPLTLSLTRFDCVTLVESCLAVARAARGAREGDGPSWARYAREMERMRYRDGARGDYASRLHYFSEWIADGERRGLLRDLGAELGGEVDARPLRFMTEHRESYPALADDRVLAAIAEVERRLDDAPRRVIPTARIADVADRIETGDVLAFATAIPGLDVTHAAFAHRGDDGVLRVLHAPLSGGTVEVTAATLEEYVARIRRATGIMIARPA
ncbi:MAG TPA: N-acetylmuramoyl-L-alanine amidase-like domain-containing protein [Gemmatimonadaceae bacterium]|nr:N-acetylmuramoyl-L-alanine amidase-like domain-containing protein [Gemmatimonadaceae bacterium]